MQEHKYWEESFRVYEKGVSLFKFPHNKEIWLSYLAHFVQRYGGTKLERSRDLFRQAIGEVNTLSAPTSLIPPRAPLVRFSEFF